MSSETNATGGLVLIDNYDSFTYNLYQVLAKLGARVSVWRNDQVSLTDLKAMRPEQLLISPGPGGPEDSGVSREALGFFAGRIPVLGVCLGHQTLAQVFGGRGVRAGRLMHGKTSWIQHDGQTIFRNLPDPFEATRYHSLIVEPESLPQEFVVSAWTDTNEIMGIRHQPTGAEGVQFHPESILTLHGEKLLENFLRC